MKRVSFEVAKAIKDAGYPQENCSLYYNKYGAIDGYLGHNTAIPYVMEAWLWLWREKKIYFGIESESYPHLGTCLNDYEDMPYLDPEEAIIAAIEYLVTNNLIK